MKRLIYLLALVNLFACSHTKRAYYDKKAKNWQDRSTNSPSQSPVHTLYLIGNTGDVPSSGENPVLDELQKMIAKEAKNSSLVYLGDQLYGEGMPSKKNKERGRAEKILNKQLDILDDFPGRTYFIPGERDWKNGRKKGLKALKRQEKYLENYYEQKDKVKMYPGNGCADPKVVKINKDLIFIFLDTQWWLQNWTYEKDINQGCDIASRHDLLKHIEETLSNHKNDEVVIFMHHPIRSNGNYGGYFSLGDQLLPLKESKNISVPLPIIGSFASLYRKISGTRQDLSNPLYKELMQGIEGIAKKFRMHVLFASAHDNSLQHFEQDKLQYIVSGSGSRSHYTTKGNGVNFAVQRKGFCKVSFYPEFEMWAEFYAMNSSGTGVELVYKKQLRAPRAGTVEESIKYPPINSPDTTLAANANFAAGPVKKEITPTLTESLAIAAPANKQEATSIDADAILVVLLNILIFINT
ncbi:MAG: metallophosphoesterase, partial [Bacteroidota bacterium]